MSEENFVTAVNSLGWEVQSRRAQSVDEWVPAITEVIGYTDDDESIEVPIEPFKTRSEAKALLEEMMASYNMDPSQEFRVYEVLSKKEKKK